MNEQNISRNSSMKAFRILWIVVFCALAIGMAACAPPAAQSHVGNRDQLLGWFKLAGTQ